jgi:hypothetical protein
VRKGLFLLAALVAGNLWEALSQPQYTPGDAHRAGLQCFAEQVLARTKPGESVHFILPVNDADGGLINHRLRYALPGRYVSTNLDMFPTHRPPDWTATWTGGCEGSLTR